MNSRRRRATDGGLWCGAAHQHRTSAIERGTGEAPLCDGADTVPRADARERETSPGMAVVAGDAISPPQRPGPAPWWSPATEIGRAVRPGGDRAPLGFVPLAAVAVAFLTLPLVALLVRAPWRSLPGDLTAPGVLTALRLSIVCSVGSAVPVARVRGAARLAAGSRPLPRPQRWFAPSCCCRWCCRRWSAASRCCSPSAAAASSASGWTAWFGITLPFTTAGAMLAETFVAMPFLVITVEAALRALDRRYEDAAATLGAGRWTRASPRDPAADRAGARRGRRALLGARARRVRRDHHLRRQLPGHDPDDAARRLPGAGERRRGGDHPAASSCWRSRWQCSSASAAAGSRRDEHSRTDTDGSRA